MTTAPSAPAGPTGTTFAAITPPAADAPTPGLWRTFVAVLWRDTFVTWREVGSFLTQVIIQPLFMLFVFGTVLNQLGYVVPGYAALLLPGIVVLTGFVTALQNTMLPMVVEFSWTNEIEDRLLAPMPIALLAVEKLLFATLRGLVAAIVMVPIGLVVLDDVAWPAVALPAAAGVLVLGCLVGAALGLVIGTSIPPQHINVMFSVLLLPLTFTGATQFPLLGLDSLRWFQVLCLVNPLTYATESVRALLIPAEQLRSLSPAIGLPVLLAAIALLTALGVRGFVRRSRS
ncbi:ABC transporter permease [Actinomycetospora sp. OC33-EN08]|uniref:Transport permease protein n=1 Tax=Actinomycetospora aurantiaca TaxID=3129233 RepID=A0ABU8MSY2_9PSEU